MEPLGQSVMIKEVLERTEWRCGVQGLGAKVISQGLQAGVYGRAWYPSFDCVR
jgi:hypothetical protein